MNEKVILEESRGRILSRGVRCSDLHLTKVFGGSIGEMGGVFYL